MLGGVLVCLGGVWAGWAIPWLVRIELVARVAADVSRLGLRWEPEGWAPRVRASGMVGELPVEIVVRWSPIGPITTLSRGGAVQEGPEAEAALALLQAG